MSWFRVASTSDAITVIGTSKLFLIHQCFSPYGNMKELMFFGIFPEFRLNKTLLFWHRNTNGDAEDNK